MKTNHTKTLIFDLDGTMYRGTSLIEEGPEILKASDALHIPYLFLTNNSMRSPEENIRHMEAMGYTGLKPEMFYNSAMAAVQYVSMNYSGRKAWYIGQEGMEQALLQGGFEITDNNPDFVFVGLDKKADYASYCKALSLMMNGAMLIGTNKDRRLPSPSGFEVGNGAVIAMFEYALDVKCPDIGKPSGLMLDLCLQHFSLSKEDVILVGDNLETDIALGYNNEVQTVFVQTGVHKAPDIERLQIFPDLTIESLLDMDLETLCLSETNPA